MINSVYDLIKVLRSNVKKIKLHKSLYDWLLLSKWDCVLSDNLKNYIKNGGIVERCEEYE